MRASAAAVTYPYAAPAAGGRRLRLAWVQNALLWLTAASGSLLFFEPSLYEVASLLTIIVFVVTGLTFRPALLPLAVLLGLMNIGFSIGAMELFNDTQPVANWILTSWYLAITCIFFAAALLTNTEQRLAALTRGYLFAAFIASLAAFIGYFHLIPGTSDLLLLFERARGTFKDPNVLGAFLVFPSVVALQGVVSGRSGHMLRSALMLAFFGGAMFLSFSRGAWGQLVFGGGLTLLLMYLTTNSVQQRARIVAMTFAVIIIASLVLIALLSIGTVADLFKQRASFTQSYDVGENGRFGRHILGAILALDVPFGIGPLQFPKIFPEDPHNSYLNAFMSGGWLSGMCYFALILLTLVHGWRHVFISTPWQRGYIVVYAAFASSAGESAIIDTDHWRHYFLLIGAMWGLMAASRVYARTTVRIPRASVLQTWRRRGAAQPGAPPHAVPRVATYRAPQPRQAGQRL